MALIFLVAQSDDFWGFGYKKGMAISQHKNPIKMVMMVEKEYVVMFLCNLRQVMLRETYHSRNKFQN